jgi:hypothetical protein
MSSIEKLKAPGKCWNKETSISFASMLLDLPIHQNSLKTKEAASKAIVSYCESETCDVATVKKALIDLKDKPFYALAEIVLGLGYDGKETEEVVALALISWVACRLKRSEEIVSSEEAEQRFKSAETFESLQELMIQVVQNKMPSPDYGFADLCTTNSDNDDWWVPGNRSFEALSEINRLGFVTNNSQEGNIAESEMISRSYITGYMLKTDTESFVARISRLGFVAIAQSMTPRQDEAHSTSSLESRIPLNLYKNKKINTFAAAIRLGVDPGKNVLQLYNKTLRKNIIHRCRFVTVFDPDFYRNGYVLFENVVACLRDLHLA